MNPEERELLERTFQTAQENNDILRKMRRTARWAVIWGFIKLAIIIVPLVVGYLYLEPYLQVIIDNLKEIRGLGVIGGF
jgi:hypothetical protein